MKEYQANLFILKQEKKKVTNEVTAHLSSYIIRISYRVSQNSVNMQLHWLSHLHTVYNLLDISVKGRETLCSFRYCMLKAQKFYERNFCVTASILLHPVIKKCFPLELIYLPY